jgi:type II secretory pathway pseudopilin PulG
MNKLKAFTVIELLVVMGVSAIIIGSATYMVFSFQSFLNTEQNVNQQNQELINIYADLQSTIAQADYFRYQNDKIMISNDNSESFIFIEDSFLVFSQDFQKQKILAQNIKITIDNENEEAEKLNSFNLAFRVKNQDYNWGFYKQYNSKENINLIYAEY